MQRALAEVDPDRPRRRRARLLGRPLRALLRAESLAHSIFPGLVDRRPRGVPLLLGGGAGDRRRRAGDRPRRPASPGSSRDVAVAVVVTTMFGAGALLALSPASPPGIENLLFGDILGAQRHRPPLRRGAGGRRRRRPARSCTGGCSPPASTAPRPARSASRPAAADAALLVLLAAAIVVAVQGLGNLLVVAVFVGPAGAARRLTDRIVPMIALAAAIAVLAGVAGLYLSYYAGTAAGASVALAIVAAYLLCAAARAARRHGG